jgi:hypothetical protein
MCLAQAIAPCARAATIRSLAGATALIVRWWIELAAVWITAYLASKITKVCLNGFVHINVLSSHVDFSHSSSCTCNLIHFRCLH